MAEPTRASPPSFGHLLRAWRGTRRRSQLELALDAAVSQRHLSFLESGRARPSREMVLALSEALDVPLRERNTLLTAAGFAPCFPQRALDAGGMEAAHAALTRILDHHDPFPAVVIDRNYDLLMANRAFDGLVGLFGDADAVWQACCPDGPRNLLRLTFAANGARPYIRNFEVIAPALIARSLREAAVRGGPVPAVLEALRDDPTIPGNWYTPPPDYAPLPVLPLVLGQSDVEISLFSLIATFGTPADVTTDEIRVESFFPADPASERYLRSLADARGA
ncbi:MAG: helix-turn-helix transcriptional regulator [Gammaproteobacteria bacterium]|nr:helix-turn-helix transcriptional regulator [Gammaproteobacteria bacterium]